MRIMHVTLPGTSLENYLLPICPKHAPFVRIALVEHSHYMPAKKIAPWIKDHINLPNLNRLMRFLKAAANNIHILK